MSLAWAFCGDSWLGPGPTEVTGLGLVLWKSLTYACSCKGHWLRPVLLKVSPSYLLLPPTCSCGCPCLRPVPTEVAISGLLLQRLLSWACSQAWRYFLNCYYLFSDDSILNQIDTPSYHIYVKARKQPLVLCLGCHWPGFLRQSLFTILEFPD